MRRCRVLLAAAVTSMNPSVMLTRLQSSRINSSRRSPQNKPIVMKGSIPKS